MSSDEKTWTKQVAADPTRRADAERNRASVLVAARRLYAERGLGVPMAAIAREAEVGKATVFRHFATPQELIDAVFADRMDDYVRATDAALEENDAWQAFVGYIGTVCEMQAEDRGFADLLTITFPAPNLQQGRERAYRGFLTIIERARGTGHLRDDFTPEDLVLVLIANAGVVNATTNGAPESWRRLLGHFLRGFANPGAPLPAVPSAPTSAALYRAMTRPD